MAILAGWLASGPHASANSISLTPSADAMVYQSTPSTSYGTRATLEVDGSPVKVSYVRFNVPQLEGSITRATLTFTVVNSSNQGGYVSTVSNTTWNESVTWNTRPSINGVQIASIGSVRSGSSVTVDVINAVKGSGALSLALTSTSSDGADYSSRESSSPPRLTIETSSTPTPTPSPSPSLTPSPTPSPSPTPPPNPNPFTVTPKVDATVDQSQPTTSLGTRSTLEVDGSPAKNIFMRFDVPQFDGSVSRATLTFSVTNSSNQGGSVTTFSNTTWNESITWNTRPSIDGNQVASIGAVQSGSTVTVDVTRAVTKSGPLSLAITSTSSDGADYASRESANQPRLTITTTSITPTPTPSPTPTPTPSPTPTPTPPPGGELPSLTLPVRAAFYYPWFPDAWDQQGFDPFTRYQPTLGYYNSGDMATIQQHIDWMKQAGLQAAIASWWGRGDDTDLNFHKALSADNSGFKWAIYHEQESVRDLTLSEIRADLSYLRDTAFTDPDYLRINGKPVVFVYNADDFDGEVAARWVPIAAEFNIYLNLKVFAGYQSVIPQPNSWHQYAPALRIDRQPGYSTTVSPGFWRIDEASPRLARDESAYADAIQQMKSSSDPWQLVTSFNEWGEGTSIEPSTSWGTDYLQLTAGSNPAPSQVVVTPAADASVYQSQPTTSFGSQSTLTVDGSPVKIFYLRFNIPQLSGMVQRATLSLTVMDPSDRGGDIYTTSNTGWTESITWNTRPAIDGPRVASVGAVSTGTRLSIDVTAGVKGSGSLSLAFTSSSSNGADYASRESSTPPTLTIVTGAGAPTPTPTPSPTSTATPPPSGTHATVIFGADIAYVGTTDGDNQTASLVQLLLAEYPDAVVQTAGDNAQGDGSLDEYTEWYAASWGAFKSITHPGIGNHDYGSYGAANYTTYFGSSAGPKEKWYYSYDLPGYWHVINLNVAGHLNEAVPGTTQYEWLKADLIANQGKNVLAVWHDPRFASGEHDDEAAPSRELWRLLDQYQAEFVVSGHDHIYERYAPQDADGNLNPQGMVQFQVGPCGEPHSVTSRDAHSLVAIGKTLGVTVMFLYADHYEWEFITVDSVVMDSGSAPVIP